MKLSRVARRHPTLPNAPRLVHKRVNGKVGALALDPENHQRMVRIVVKRLDRRADRSARPDTKRS